MTTVFLTIHIIIVVALVGIVLMQKTDGAGGLGMGGGGAGGGLMSGRGVANALTKSTTFLGILFFASSLGLAMFANRTEDFNEAATELTGEKVIVNETGEIQSSDDLLDSLGGNGEPEAGADISTGDLLKDLGAAPAVLEDAAEGIVEEETAPASEETTPEE